MTEPHIPGHIAIIMDGNNRWAKLHGKRKLEDMLPVRMRFVV